MNRIDILENREPVPFCGCYLWMRGTNGAGYGMVWFGGRMQLAHRIVYETFFGPIPDGAHVLHKCDTPLCCNPRHLFLGTTVDNMRDCWEKGRNYFQNGGERGHGAPNHGEANGRSKLTDSQVREIRELHTTGEYSYRKLASMYGVTYGLIGHIVRRKAWAHV